MQQPPKHQRTLRELMDVQSKQQSDIAPPRSTSRDDEMLLREYLLGAHSELVELEQAAARFRSHRLVEGSVNRRSVAHQIADALKYLFSIAWLLDVSPEEVTQGFDVRTQVVYDRIRSQNLDLADKRVLVTDMDGVLCDTFGAFPELKVLKGRAMDRRWAELLSSGEWVKARPIRGAQRILARIRREYKGVLHVVVTTRRSDVHCNIHGDTLSWLTRYGMAPDLLLFNKDKGEEIAASVMPAQILLVVEDKLKHCLDVAELDVPVCAFGFDAGGVQGIESASNWDEVYKLLIRLRGSSQ